MPSPRSYHFLTMAAALLALVTACSKVVRLDLENAERKLVVEGMLTDDSVQVINLRRTSDFYQQTQDLVQAARVVLERPGGQRDTLRYVANGDYVADGFQPEVYKTYGLHIEDGENTYSSSLIFPGPVQIEQAYYVINPQVSPLGVALVSTRDTPGVPNYYRLRAYVNDTINPRQYVLFSDQDPDKEDGGLLSAFIYLGAGFQSGDTVITELLSLDEGAYNYFEQLRKALNNSNTVASPFNPVGNIVGEGEAFGYFGAMQRDTSWFVVP